MTQVQFISEPELKQLTVWAKEKKSKIKNYRRKQGLVFLCQFNSVDPYNLAAKRGRKGSCVVTWHIDEWVLPTSHKVHF